MPKRRMRIRRRRDGALVSKGAMQEGRAREGRMKEGERIESERGERRKKGVTEEGGRRGRR
jgi:hypothetical protein